jgi:TRAP-type C4-dicarboxylate transport system permease small subunit
MINRAANFVRKVIEPTTHALAAVGVVVLGAMVLMLIVSVIMRKAFNAPMKGVFELSEFGMVMITFLFVSAQYFKPDSMVMDTFVEMFPKTVKRINNAVIFLLDVAILAILSWQLYAYGLKVQAGRQVSKILEIPLYPFVYLGAVCMLLLTLVFAMKFLFSLNEFGRRA